MLADDLLGYYRYCILTSITTLSQYLTVLTLENRAMSYNWLFIYYIFISIPRFCHCFIGYNTRSTIGKALRGQWWVRTVCPNEVACFKHLLQFIWNGLKCPRCHSFFSPVKFGTVEHSFYTDSCWGESFSYISKFDLCSSGCCLLVVTIRKWILLTLHQMKIDVKLNLRSMFNSTPNISAYHCWHKIFLLIPFSCSFSLEPSLLRTTCTCFRSSSKR